MKRVDPSFMHLSKRKVVMASKTTEHNRQGFITLFNSIARHKHRYTVFSDFVIMCAIALHNAICMSKELENEYLEIVGRYSKEEVNTFCELFAILVNLLDSEPKDVLGTLYMELELTSTNNGQFFTPHEVSILLAKITYGEVLDNLEKPFITLSEPACGAGGMVLAFVSEMLKKGINPAEKLFVNCIDIDRVAGLMCYVQLSLWHIPAEIIIGDTLSLKFREIYYTPSYHLGRWNIKLGMRNLLNSLSSLSEPIEQHEVVEFNEIQVEKDFSLVKELEPTKTKKDHLKNGTQVDLFDFMIDH